MPGLNHLVRLAAVGLAVMAAGCSKNTNPTTPTDTLAEPTITESFVGRIGVGGASFYSFTVGKYGTVNLVLNALNGVDGDVQLGLGLGVPVGFTCNTNTNQNGATGATISSPFQPGIYCAKVSDIGNLSGSMAFNVSIAHP